MKTPMQELIDEMQKSPLMFASALTLIDEIRLLKKEQAVIIESFHEGMRCHMFDPSTGIAEEYYNVKFIENNK